MSPNEQRRKSIIDLLKDAYDLKSETERWLLTPSSPSEKFRLNRELQEISTKITIWETEIEQLEKISVDENFSTLDRSDVANGHSELAALRQQLRTITPSNETEKIGQLRRLRIFLCHSKLDKSDIHDLYMRLLTDGFAPWLDEEDLLPGQNWQIEIPKAVRTSDVILICFSNRSHNKPGYIHKELKMALEVAEQQPEGVIFLIPVRLEDCSVSESLSQLQRVDLFHPNGYDRLLRALKARTSLLQQQQMDELFTNLNQAELNENWDKAIELGEEIIKLDISIVDMRYRTAKAYYKRGSYYSNKKQGKRAINDFDRAIELKPDYTKAYIERGINYSDLDNDEQAIKDLDYAENLEPDNPEPYFIRGYIYYELEKYQKALQDFNQAIRLEPDNEMAFYDRGGVYYHLGEHSQAIEDYTQAIMLKPNDSHSFYMRGLTYYEMGNKLAAKDDFQKACDLGNSNAREELDNLNEEEAIEKLIADLELSEQEENWDKAIEAGEALMHLAPSHENTQTKIALFYVNKAIVFMQLGQYEQAIQGFNRAVQLDPSNTEIYIYRGVVYEQLNQDKKAIQDFNRALDLDHSDKWMIYYNRGIAFKKLRWYEKAIEDYNRALDLKPSFLDAFNGRGLIYYELKQYEKAIQDYSSAIQLDSNYAFAYFNRGLVYKSMKNKKAARRDFQRASELGHSGAEIELLLLRSILDF